MRWRPFGDIVSTVAANALKIVGYFNDDMIQILMRA